MLPSRVSVPFPRTFYRPAFYPSRISLSFLLSLLLPRLSLSLVCSRSRGSCDDWRIYGLLLRRAFISSECKLRSRAALHVLLVDTYRWLQRGGDRPREKELLSSGLLARSDVYNARLCGGLLPEMLLSSLYPPSLLLAVRSSLDADF